MIKKNPNLYLKLVEENTVFRIPGTLPWKTSGYHLANIQPKKQKTTPYRQCCILPSKHTVRVSYILHVVFKHTASSAQTSLGPSDDVPHRLKHLLPPQRACVGFNCFFELVGRGRRLPSFMKYILI